MSTTTYSFSDILTVIKHPSYAAYTLNGQGLGEISISYANDNTDHNLAADGSVMVSRVRADNGSVSITAQQTSQLHQWLKGLFNYLNNPDTATSQWAGIQINISSPNGGFDNITLNNVSFTKRADQPYQQQGQMVTWNFMFANGQTIGTTQPAIFNNI